MTLGLSLAQAQTGCLVSDACNYDAVATVSDNTCYFIGSACNDGDASTINDVRITCNTCLGTAVVFGCMDNSACNYSLLANVSENCKYENDFCDDNNGATIFDKLDDVCVCLGVAAVAGCMDPTMCNYNETANVPGPCIAAPYTANGTECWVCSQTIDAIADPSTPHGNGQGVLLDNDINDNGQCDDTEIIGCMDSTACNYNPNATTLNVFAANGSPCEFALVGCEYCGVLDQNGVPFRYSSVNLNSDSEAVISVGDSLEITTFDAFGQPEQGVSTHPLYVVINNDDDDSVCNQDEVQGCTLATACNYDSNATNENGSCVFPGECDCVTTGGVQFSVPSASSSPSALAKDIPDGDCDCNGSTLDALDVCGGTCLLDADSNGVCDALEVLGCMDETACNYNEALGVNVDDNTCVLPGTCGCNDDAALDLPITDCDCGGEKLDALEECLLESDPSWCVADTNNNDLCDASEIPGCTNLSACNYNAGLEATFDDGTCVYADTNENGLCDDSEISGCTDSSACNYIPAATVSDGSCEYESCATLNELAWTVEDVHTEGELAGACTYRVYAISESNVSLAGGDSDRPLSLSGTSEIYNNPFVSGPTLNSINQGVLDMAPLAEFDSWVTLGIEFSESECSISTVNSPNQPWQSFFTPNTSTTSIVIDDEFGGGWYSTSDCNNSVSSTPGQVLLVQVTTWGDLEGEIPFATIEGEESVWHTGSFNIKPGCLDELAINFRADATHDNATCIYGEAGCMDILACNFLNTAVVDDGSCEYATLGYDCFDVCLIDSDSDGVCDEFEIFGCTEPTASNYNDEATEEDSTCIIYGCLYAAADNFNTIANTDDNSCVFSGCLDDTAINYSLLANSEDNTCLYLGCMDSIALNFNPSANLAGPCEYCAGDINFDGEIQLDDLLDLLTNYGQSCD